MSNEYVEMRPIDALRSARHHTMLLPDIQRELNCVKYLIFKMMIINEIWWIMIEIRIYYTGKEGKAKEFANEMIASKVVDRIRSEEGNLEYSYFIPLGSKDTVMLIDSWENQEAIDKHHNSPMMAEIIRLREKYDLTMKVERKEVVDSDIPDYDNSFIKK